MIQFTAFDKKGNEYRVAHMAWTMDGILSAIGVWKKVGKQWEVVVSHPEDYTISQDLN